MGIEGNPVASGFSAHGSAQTLAAAWDRLLERLPDDWSHLYAEVELRPNESRERVALIACPLNPERCDGRSAFRFRVGRGASVTARRPSWPGVASSGSTEARVPGHLRLLQLLCEKRPVETQGPVWRLGGRSL